MFSQQIQSISTDTYDYMLLEYVVVFRVTCITMHLGHWSNVTYCANFRNTSPHVSFVGLFDDSKGFHKHVIVVCNYGFDHFSSIHNCTKYWYRKIVQERPLEEVKFNFHLF